MVGHITVGCVLFKLGAAGHSTTVRSNAQLLHPGSKTLLFSEAKMLRFEHLLGIRVVFSHSWLCLVVVRCSFSVELS